MKNYLEHSCSEKKKPHEEIYDAPVFNIINHTKIEHSHSTSLNHSLVYLSITHSLFIYILFRFVIFLVSAQKMNCQGFFFVHKQN